MQNWVSLLIVIALCSLILLWTFDLTRYYGNGFYCYGTVSLTSGLSSSLVKWRCFNSSDHWPWSALEATLQNCAPKLRSVLNLIAHKQNMRYSLKSSFLTMLWPDQDHKLNQQSALKTLNNGFCVKTDLFHPDINECIRDYRNNCSENANCTNTVGSFYCTCVSGYTGDGYTCVASKLLCSFLSPPSVSFLILNWLYYLSNSSSCCKWGHWEFQETHQ